jgi:CDGSH-type Zn-finger protein
VGASDNKPFCDGTHAIIGFSSENKGIEKDRSGEEKLWIPSHLHSTQRKIYRLAEKR